MAVFRVECMQMILYFFSGALLSTASLVLLSVYTILKNRVWFVLSLSSMILAISMILLSATTAGIRVLPEIVGAGVATFAIFLWFIACVQMYRTFA